MEIGDKRIILFDNTKYNFDYDYVLLNIIEKKIGKGEFTGKEYPGYLAMGNDGYLYGYNYPITNEGFCSAIMWTRYMPIDYKNKKFEDLSEKEKDELVSKFIWTDVVSWKFDIKPKKLLDKYNFLKYSKTSRGVSYI